MTKPARSSAGWRRALSAVLPRSPAARIAIAAVVVLVVLSLLDPVFSLIGRALDMLAWLRTGIGRLVALNGLLVIGVLVFRRRLGVRMRDVRDLARVVRLKAGIETLIAGHPAAAAETLRRLARDQTPSARVPFAALQAQLGAVRGDLDCGATSPLPSVPADTAAELRRSATQLRVQLVRNATADPALLAAAIEEGLSAFPDDVLLLRARRDFELEQGDLAAALMTQTRIVDGALPAERKAERRRLADDIAREGERLLAGTPRDLDRARELADEARRADPDAASPRMLLGAIAEGKGDHHGALRHWSDAGDTTGWTRVLAALDAPDARFAIADLLEAVPHEAALALLWREAMRRGQLAFAERAARVLQRRVGPTRAANSLLDRTKLALESVDRSTVAPSRAMG